MDKINLNDISCKTQIGVSPEERKSPQLILVDLVLHLDLEEASRNDDLNKTVDYVELIDQIQKTTQEGHFRILESLACKLCQTALRNHRIQRVEVTVRKFPKSLRKKLTHVSVKMARDRKETRGDRLEFID